MAYLIRGNTSACLLTYLPNISFSLNLPIDAASVRIITRSRYIETMPKNPKNSNDQLIGTLMHLTG